MPRLPKAKNPKTAKNPKSGGRVKGTRNKLTQMGFKHALMMADKGYELPHEFLWRVMRAETEFDSYAVDQNTGKGVRTRVWLSLEQRIDAAKAAAPYIAPRLSLIDANVKRDPFAEMDTDDLKAHIVGLLGGVDKIKAGPSIQ